MSDATVSVRAARAPTRIARAIELSLGPLELSPNQYRVMAYLSEGETSASTLARLVPARAPYLSNVIDGLVGRGLVRRGIDKRDGRKRILRLTPAGERLLDIADTVVRARLQAIAAHLDPHERTVAMQALSLWAAAIDAFWNAEYGP